MGVDESKMRGGGVSWWWKDVLRMVGWTMLRLHKQGRKREMRLWWKR